MRLASVAVALLALAQTPAAGSLVKAMPPAPAKALDVDSLLVRIRQPLKSPEGPVTLRRGWGKRLTIRGRDRFQAKGKVTGNRFHGVAHMTRDSIREQVLECRVLESYVIEAVFFERSGTPILVEEWHVPLRNLIPRGPRRSSAQVDTTPLVRIRDLPEAISKVNPAFPENHRYLQDSSLVLLNVLVGRDGRVKDVRIAASIPFLDDVAAEAIRQWRFRPAFTFQNQPVAVWTFVPMRFVLRER